MAKGKPVFICLAEYTKRNGVESIKDTVYHSKVDEHWELWINGTKEQVKVGPNNTVSLKPFYCYVEFNGWPAGFFHPYGGEFAAGTLANEDTFCEALERGKP